MGSLFCEDRKGRFDLALAGCIQWEEPQSESFRALLQFFDFRRGISRIFGVAEIADKLGGGH